MMKKILLKILFEKKTLNLDARHWVQRYLLRKQYSKKIINL